jgi:hypothetical protein
MRSSSWCSPVLAARSAPLNPSSPPNVEKK